MPSLTLHYGPSIGFDLTQSSLIMIGKHSNIKMLAFEHVSVILSGIITENAWLSAMENLEESGTISLHQNRATLISIPDKVSRYNSPSNSAQLYKSLQQATIAKSTKRVNVVLITEYDDVIPSVAAIARCFPVYSKKTKENELLEVNIDIIIVDDKMLTEGDVAFLTSLIDSIRTSVRLIDTPSNELSTEGFVKEIMETADLLGVNYTLIQGDQLKDQGFGGIYAVGKSGPTAPAFVVLSYLPHGAYETYALVGKGVVFDTGGYSLKNSNSMRRMKRDMAGAANILGAFTTLVNSGFKQNLYACFCIVENSIGPMALKPDDIITMMSGKTVEVTDTDCEGRLILADGVYYAKNVLRANTIIDMATLTDNSVISGKFHAAILTNSATWEEQICEAGRRSGDLLVPVVFCPELHFSDLNSKLADMINCPIGRTEGPFSALGGLFIGSHIDFGEGLNWIHLDIAFPELTGNRGYGFGSALLSVLLGNMTNVPLLQANTHSLTSFLP